MKMRKTLSAILCLLMVATVFAVGGPLNVIAENPGLQGEWWVEGNGTYFELTNSTYLNISLTSSENVHIYLESTPNMVCYQIEANSTATTTDITLTGFEASKTYYRYQDGDLQENFTSGGDGSYSYTQEISTYHDIFILETDSTIYIYSDGSVSDPTKISRNGETYIQIDDIYESVYIKRSGITFDGNGYSISGSTEYGIFLYHTYGVTITNTVINGFYWGILMQGQTSYNTISGNTVSGICGIKKSGSGSGNTISGNTLSCSGNNGIYIYLGNSNTIGGNTVTGSTYDLGIFYSNSNTISGNTISSTLSMVKSNGNTLRNNVMGGFGVFYMFDAPHHSDYIHDIDTSNTIDGKPIYYWVGRSYETVPSDAGYVGIVDSDHITVQDLTLTGNREGIFFAFTTDSTIKNVIAQDNTLGILLVSSSRNIISDNTVMGNTEGGIWLRSYSNSNTLSGNAISNNRYTGIVLSDSSSNTLSRNNILNHRSGIYTTRSHSNTISGNIVSAGDFYGITLMLSNSNIISGNTVSSYKYGLLINAHSNIIFHNNIIDNTYQLLGNPSTTTWDNGAGEGNFWSDYTGLDDGSGGRIPDDGVGDTNLPHQGADWYPLMNPYPNTPIGTDVEVLAGVGVSMHFSEVSSQGFTYAEQVSGSPPANFRLLPSQTYYDITTTATFEGIINISLPYDDNGLTLKQENRLKFKYLDETTGDWIDITTWVDTDKNLIYGETTHLSIFAIMIRLNIEPIAEAGGPYEADEGTEIMFDASGSSDPDGDELYYRWDFDNNGIWDTEYSTDPTAIHTWYDDFSDQVIVEVYDGEYTDTDTATVMVSNVPPTIIEVTAPIDPIIVNTEIIASGTFTDPGTGDTHTATWLWDDGSYSDGQVIGGTVTGSHLYSEAGVYTITLIVTDDDGGSDQMDFQYVVIYDPEGGFVTGGGWIDSPEGAYIPDPSLTGKASFGFVSKYTPGAAAPTGNTEFQFKVTDLNFHSSNYEWLVIAGATAQFKGTGTINKEGEYKFKIWATDGALLQMGGCDKFRIKIWEEDEFGNEYLIYDNKEETELGGGQIVIHKA